MIRINLLPQDKVRGKTKVSSGPAGDATQKITIASTLVLIVAVVTVGWWYRSIALESTRIAEEIAAAEQETSRLRSIIAQVQKFEQQKVQLQQRVTLIEQLRKGQNAPVHMLDEISRNLPEMVWLTRLEQHGADVTIEGRCSALTSLSDFVNALEASGWFKKPVEITDSEVERSATTDIDVIRFSIKAQTGTPGT